MRKLAWITIALATFALADETVTVPLTPVVHLMTLEAKINGKGPYRFVFDSGAAGSMRISAEIATALSLEQIGEVVAGDPSGKNAERRPLMKIDAVDIGTAHFTNVQALTASARGPVPSDGVIGLGLFKGMTVTIDYPKKEMRISRDPLPPTGDHVLAYTMARGIPEIDIDAAGVPLHVDVDTGSPSALSIPGTWAAKLPLGEQRVVGHGRTTTNEFDIRGADLKGDLHVAGFTITAPRVDIVDLFPVANIGARLFHDYVVTFDTVNKRMSLAR